MKLLFDCRPETMYPLAGKGFSGGSQTYVKAIIREMLSHGHQVHVIANDLTEDQQRGPSEFWWTKDCHPHKFDIAVQQMHLIEPDYDAESLVLMTSCCDPFMGPNHEWSDAPDLIPCFSEKHKELLLKLRPGVKPERCVVTGLGVDLEDYAKTNGSLAHIHGRLLYANDPARGLFYTMDVFDIVKKHVPEATLHIAYDFDRQFSWRQWEHSLMAQLLWGCYERIKHTPGIVNVGSTMRQGIIQEQLECHVHCMPSDPPGVGTQTHGLTQMECAAAGVPLVLSNVEAFPEVFGEAAVILPTIGTFDGALRYDALDYANEVVKLMTDPTEWRRRSEMSHKLASTHTWKIIGDRWNSLLEGLL